VWDDGALWVVEFLFLWNVVPQEAIGASHTWQYDIPTIIFPDPKAPMLADCSDFKLPTTWFCFLEVHIPSKWPLTFVRIPSLREDDEALIGIWSFQPREAGLLQGNRHVETTQIENSEVLGLCIDLEKVTVGPTHHCTIHL